MTQWWQASDEELLHALTTAQHRINAHHRAMLTLVAEVAARKLGPTHGYVTDTELLQCTQNISKADARRRLSAAADVLPGRTGTGETVPAPLPATAAALAQDAISADHVAVIQRVLGSLAAHLDRHRGELERYLAEQARVFDPPAVRLLGERRILFLDPDGPRPKDRAPTRNRLSFAADGDGWDLRGWLDRESAAIVQTALSPLTAPRPAQDTRPAQGTGPAQGAGPDPRTLPERTADGVVELARRSLIVGDLPTEGGERPQVVVTIPLALLESRLGNGLLDFGDGTLAGAIAAEDARRWACDARVVPIVVGGRSEPLDIGRAAYTIPRAMRRALKQRDGGCAFPGCTVPAQWADGHHIVHWADGGITALSNLVLLCGHHHTVIHHGEWEVAITGGFPMFHPPPWIPGGPRRNTLHRIDLAPTG